MIKIETKKWWVELCSLFNYILFGALRSTFLAGFSWILWLRYLSIKWPGDQQALPTNLINNPDVVEISAKLGLMQAIM